ncbi:hypothetical protein ACS0TY_003452 [Phlomoides rotata]
MEERCLVNKPRGISDADDLGSPKLWEVYGFIISITIVVATGALIIWAYVPEHWLHNLGIYYYPSRYQALPVPTYVLVTIILGIGVYIGLNFLATPPPTSLKTMFDEFSKELLDDDDLAIGSLSDIGISNVNELLNDFDG